MMITLKFELDKPTKNTVRFKEVLSGPLEVAQVGVIYVPKSTLKNLGWSEGKPLMLHLEVK